MANWYEPIAQAQEAENFRATQQQNRLALKVQQMQLGELEKQTGVKNFLSANWRQMTAPVQDQPGQAPPMPQPNPPVQQNTLAPAPTPGAGMINTMANPQPAPQGPVGPLQPPGAAMQPPATGMPPMGPRVQPGGAPGAPAQQPQYPSDDELMKAIQSGKIPPEVADGVRAERVQYEATQKQAYVQEKLKRLDMLSKAAVESGDNDTFQQIAKAAKDDPDVAPFLPKLDSIKIPARGEVETVRNYSESDIQQVAGKFPQLEIDPSATPAGAYKLLMKNGKPAKWEPVKESTPKTAESMELDSLLREARKKFPNDVAKQEAWASAEELKRKAARDKQRTQVNVSIRESARAGRAKAGDLGLKPVNKPLAGPLETLAQKIANGTMRPSQLPKRRGSYEQILARAATINPDLDISESDISGKLMASATFRSRMMTTESMPEILQQVVDAGKKVNFSHYRIKGIAEQFMKGQLNDPDLVEYMTLRNDALLSIAATMRGTGATDQAHRVEIEAAHPTMDGPSLNAWLRGQMKSLKPRLKQYEDIRSGRKSGGTPRTGAAPRSASGYLSKYGE